MKKSGLLGIIIGAVGVYFGYKALVEVDKLRDEIHSNKTEEDGFEDDNIDWCDEDDDRYYKHQGESDHNIDIMVPKDNSELEKESETYNEESEQVEVEVEPEIAKDTSIEKQEHEENLSNINDTEEKDAEPIKKSAIVITEGIQ